VADDTNTPELVNIAFEAATDKGIKWNELKPALLIMRFIEAIETKYGITFSRDFIGNASFDGLYMWLSRDKGDLKNPAKGSEGLINWTSQTNTTFFLDLATNRFSETVFFETVGAEYFEEWFNYTITITPDDLNAEYSIIVRDADQNNSIVGSKNNVKGIQSLGGQVRAPVPDVTTPFDIGFYVSAQGSLTFTAVVDINNLQQTIDDTGDNTVIINDNYQAASGSITSTLVLASFVPSIKVIDFINGIVQMFNLAIVPVSDKSFFMDTLDSWYSAGLIYDIDHYIDFDKDILVDRTNILSDIKFNFQEPQTFLADEFRDSNNTIYGDLELLLEDGNGKLLDGESLQIQLPFEQIIYGRLTDDNDNVLTDIQQGYIVDEKQDPTLPKPHLFYGLLQSTGSKTFGLLDDSQTPTQISNAFMPFHGREQTDPTQSTLWGSDLNEWDGIAITNSLFNKWYNDYISDIFSVRRRMYKFTAVLPLNLVTVIELNDILIIREIPFIINNMQINFTTGIVEFELLNFIGSLAGVIVGEGFDYDLDFDIN